ncbi:MAG: phosphonate C-P lyase system protein PhnL [Alphaproteobacteria bacterium]|nr:phosphonate C-P lyase system protein PhnL [Alphaproteobacteria bacterium]
MNAVEKSFVLHLQDGITIPVLRDFAFEVRAGECVALAGVSGAGKSTFLKCLYGNYKPERGDVWIRHRDGYVNIAKAEPRTILEVRRESVSYVSQFLRVVPRVSARDIVAERLLERGLDSESAAAKATDLLSRLNISAKLHRLPPATFSGGEQQRVNLARGFLAPSSLLLLDEPTASLDADNRQVVVKLIREAKERGTAVVGIFHDLEIREAVADRVFDILRLTE